MAMMAITTRSSIRVKPRCCADDARISVPPYTAVQRAVCSVLRRAARQTASRLATTPRAARCTALLLARLGERRLARDGAVLVELVAVRVAAEDVARAVPPDVAFEPRPVEVGIVVGGKRHLPWRRPLSVLTWPSAKRATMRSPCRSQAMCCQFSPAAPTSHEDLGWRVFG